MPIYEYSCPNCGLKKEVRKDKFTERRPKCPDCRSLMDRQISPGGFILAGDGWPGKS